MKKKVSLFFVLFIIMLSVFGSVGAQNNRIFITFGRYEQDNNKNNGKEEIEWEILDIIDDQALLVTKKALDTKPYNESRNEVTWETSSLRKWLNGDFYNNAFNASEKEKISYFTITNHDNPQYGTKGGNSTSDRVFLLSLGELLKYYTNSSMRECEATSYVKANSGRSDTVDQYNRIHYWLRTPGATQMAGQTIGFDGSVDGTGFYVDSKNYIGVRPAIWLDWNKLNN